MTWLVVQEKLARLAVRSRGLVVMQQDSVIERLHARGLRGIALLGPIEVTAAARTLILRDGVDVVFLDGRGRYLGRMTSARGHMAMRRIQQVEQMREEEFRAAVARRIISAKMMNQREVLMRARRQHGLTEDQITNAITRLRHLSRGASGARGQGLMGIEGSAAAAYFGVFGKLLRTEHFSFRGRNRRPPRDAVNACLSFCYMLLLGWVEGSVWKSGLEPWVGVLHEPGPGKPSLVLDLMEPWRPFVDRVVLRMFNRDQLVPEDFEDPGAKVFDLDAELEEGDDRRAVWLGRTGRAVVFREMGAFRRSRIKVDWLGGRYTVEEVIARQAQAIARAVESGDPRHYEPQLMG